MIEASSPKIKGMDPREFNFQKNAVEKGSQYTKSLEDWNKHPELISWQKRQIQNSLNQLMDRHLHAILSGKTFHGDLHAGNIFIELNDVNRDYPVAKKVKLIDGGTAYKLTENQKGALAALFGLQKHIDKYADDIIKMKQGHLNVGDVAKVEHYDNLIQRYMKGLRAEGIQGGMSTLDIDDYREFLDFFRDPKPGKPYILSSDQVLRNLNLKPEVVSAMKAI